VELKVTAPHHDRKLAPAAGPRQRRSRGGESAVTCVSTKLRPFFDRVA
jgi:hypothetical protein